MYGKWCTASIRCCSTCLTLTGSGAHFLLCIKVNPKNLMNLFMPKQLTYILQFTVINYPFYISFITATIRSDIQV